VNLFLESDWLFHLKSNKIFMKWTSVEEVAIRLATIKSGLSKSALIKTAVGPVEPIMALSEAKTRRYPEGTPTPDPIAAALARSQLGKPAPPPDSGGSALDYTTDATARKAVKKGLTGVLGRSTARSLVDASTLPLQAGSAVTTGRVSDAPALEGITWVLADSALKTKSPSSSSVVSKLPVISAVSKLPVVSAVSKLPVVSALSKFSPAGYALLGGQIIADDLYNKTEHMNKLTDNRANEPITGASSLSERIRSAYKTRDGAKEHGLSEIQKAMDEQLLNLKHKQNVVNEHLDWLKYPGWDQPGFRPPKPRPSID
jgi:hypothetical protein